MYSIEDAKKIERKVVKEKIFFWKGNVNILEGIEYKFYLYSDELERANHVNEMKLDGWIYESDQKNALGLYLNPFSFGNKNDIFVSTAYFKKELTPMEWD